MEAVDGQQSVTFAASYSYDLIFLDIHMPRLNGIEATQKIREQEPFGKRVPIIAMTANALPGTRERLINNGMDDFLTKPILEAQLWKTCLNLLASSEKTVLHSALEPVATSLQQELPVYDQSLAMLSTGNNLQLAKSFNQTHLAELQQSLPQLKALFLAQNYAELKDLVHTLHGSAAYCGVPELKYAELNLENKLIAIQKAQPVDDLPAAFDALLVAIEKVIAYFSEGKHFDH